MCERCNPLGLKQPAATQAHGTIFLGLGVAVLGLFFLANLAVSGIGPFSVTVLDVTPAQPGMQVTISVTNGGSKTGATSCRIWDRAAGIDPAIQVFQTPRIDPGASVTIDPGRPGADAAGPRPRGRVPGPVTRSDSMAVAPSGGDASATESTAEELAFAIETAEDAGRILMDRYERLERIDYKSARDVVTEADHLSEEHVIAAIRAAFPGDGIVAEESGTHDRTDGTAATTATGRSWVVDPLDGTVNYANGIPFFCVSIALVVDGLPRVGAVHDPTRQETFAASVDGPARLGPDAIRVSAKERLSDFVISLALSGTAAAERNRRVRRAVRIPRSMGSAALGLVYVANGRFDAFVQQGGLSSWDVAAAGLIAERAGAIVTDLDGGRWFDLARPARTIGLLAAPPDHHATLLELVRPRPSTRVRASTRARPATAKEAIASVEPEVGPVGEPVEAEPVAEG